MKTSILFLAIAVVSLVLVGCVSTVPKMKAESMLNVSGNAFVTETTTTTVINPDGTKTVTTVEKSVTKSAAAADLEIKSTELNGRTAVGVADAKSCSFWNPCYAGYGNVYGGGYVTPYNGGGYVQPYNYSSRPVNNTGNVTSYGTVTAYQHK